VAEIKKTVVSVFVYESLKKMIFEGTLNPGAKIDRKEIAERLGISQTPLNDALNKLTGEGIVEARGREGYFVPDYGPRELAEFFVVRAGLEGVAARLCAEEADGEVIRKITSPFDAFSVAPAQEQLSAYLKADRMFHAGIIVAANVGRLSEIDSYFGFAFRSYEHGLVRPPHETLSEHRAIIAAIRARDGKTAQFAMTDHLLRTRAALLVRVEAVPGE